jgi:hypothetical protein
MGNLIDFTYPVTCISTPPLGTNDKLSKTEDHEFQFVAGRSAKRRRAIECSDADCFNSRTCAALIAAGTDKRHTSP